MGTDRASAICSLQCIKLIVKVATKHPELRQEMKLLTQEHYLDTLSPGIRHCIERMANVQSAGNKSK
jgi:hypothetical protein